MPLFCYIHSGDYVHGDSEGCQHVSCIKFRNTEMPPERVLVGSIPGGYNDTCGDAQYDFQKNFDKGLHAYKKARDDGLRPSGTSVEAVKAAQREAASQSRALKVLEKAGADTTELRRAEGVE